MPSKIEQVRLLSRQLDDLDAQISALQEEKRTVEAKLSMVLGNAPLATSGRASLDQDREDDPDDSSKPDLLLDMLRQNPRLDYQKAAKAIYGESNSKTYNRVAALVTFLKRKGKIRNVARGKWEVVHAPTGSYKGALKK